MPHHETAIDGVFLFTPRVFGDSRGRFYESFRADQILVECGLEFNVYQVNNSISSKGVLRGIHFKEDPPGQQKFVSVTSGAIIDVTIDLRLSSPTFKKWQAFQLNEKNMHSVLIGNGIGHVFLALQDDTRVTYLCDSVYEPEKEHSISPLSADIDWEHFASKFAISDLLLSDKDRNAPKLDEAKAILFP